MNVAIAKITTPADVQAQLAISGDTYDPGAIFIEIAEAGMSNQLIYCRYALPIPYYEVQIDDKVLVVHTQGSREYPERYFYIGVVDVAGAIPTEPFVFGNVLKTYLETMIDEIKSDIVDEVNTFWTNVFNTHTHLYAPGPGAPTPSGTPSVTQSNTTSEPTKPTADILSTEVFGK